MRRVAETAERQPISLLAAPEAEAAEQRQTSQQVAGTGAQQPALRLAAGSAARPQASRQVVPAAVRSRLLVVAGAVVVRERRLSAARLDPVLGIAAHWDGLSSKPPLLSVQPPAPVSR